MPPAQAPEHLLHRLPLPLARLCRNAINAADPFKRYTAAYCLWEAGLKLLASAAIAECARRQARETATDAEVGTLVRPMLGHWRKYARVMVPALADAGVDAFVPARDAFARPHADLPHAALLDAALDRLGAGETDLDRALASAPPGRKVNLAHLFDRLITHRNDLAHGAMGQNETRYRRLAPVLLAGVCEILDRGCLLPGRLVFVEKVEMTAAGEFAVSRFDLTGDSPMRLDPLTFPASAAERLPVRSRVYLEVSATQPEEVFRSLHPLVLFEPDAEEVFFLNSGFGEPESSYLCYTRDVKRARTDLRGDQRRTLDDLLGPAPGRASRPDPTLTAHGTRETVGTPITSEIASLYSVLLEAIGAARGVTVNALRAAYRDAVPVGWEVVDGGRIPAEALAAYCNDLRRCPLQAGAAPLLTFARALVPQCPSDRAPSITDAIRSAADFLGETLPVIAAPAPAAPGPGTPADEPAVLLFAIRPAVSEADRYEIKAWLSVRGETTCLAAGEERHTREDLPGAVDRFRGLAATHAVGTGLWVEFLLPRELIPEAVDQWEVTVDEGCAFPVGAEHPVLVRAADRYYCPRQFRAKRLAALRERGRGLGGCGPARVIRDLPPPDQTPGVVLYARDAARGDLLYAHLLDDRAVLGAVFDEPPPPESTGRWDVLVTLFAVGMPVVAWGRNRRRAAEQLVALITNCRFGDVPARVREWRLSAVGADPEDSGRHVALLWDDPDRPPPDCEPQNQLRAR
jgi:hypothetical protein